MTVPITVAHGDGIGPEIMVASLRILETAGAALDIETVEVGEPVYLQGHSSGIAPQTWESLRRTQVLYKGPITTPQGGGYKSLNVTIRKTMGLFANVRPCASYAPFIHNKHPLMDLVIIRENEEDVYGGIEYRQTQEVYQALKLVSQPGSEKIIRYAFEYARRNNRRSVECFTKDNIMKMTDGLFHSLFEEIASEYLTLEHGHRIVDIGAALLADHPEQFDVIVVPNLYGDIISDVAAQLTGSIGLGASANVGRDMAMFEAIHGAAPDISGQGTANPSGLLLAGVMMLNYIGQPEVAERVHNAWLCVLEEGIHTPDIFDRRVSKERVGTEEFTRAVIERLGQAPHRLRPVSYTRLGEPIARSQVIVPPPRQYKELVGVDVYLDWDDDGRDAARLGSVLEAVAGEFKLVMITNRGQVVWPGGAPETFRSDHWRCRFEAGGTATHSQVIELLARMEAAGFDFIKTENLYNFDGEPGYSLGQGQ